MTKRTDKICKECGTIYKFGVHEGPYCSYPCKEKSKKRARLFLTLVCKKCGNQFETLHVSVGYCPQCEKSIPKGKGTWIIFNRDDFRCIYCGKSSVEDGVKLHADHIYPRSLGGDDYADNLVTSCINCNLSKLAGVLDGDIMKRIKDVVYKRNEEHAIPHNLSIKDLLLGDL